MRLIAEVTRRTDDEDTISFDAPGFTTVRTCRHCGVLIAGGPNACVHCVAARRPNWLRRLLLHWSGGSPSGVGGEG